MKRRSKQLWTPLGQTTFQPMRSHHPPSSLSDVESLIAQGVDALIILAQDCSRHRPSR